MSIKRFKRIGNLDVRKDQLDHITELCRELQLHRSAILRAVIDFTFTNRNHLEKLKQNLKQPGLFSNE